MLTKEQLIDCFVCVFLSTHSPGFMEAEMKNLLYEEDYRFLERPRAGWREALSEKLRGYGFDYSRIRILN